MSISRSPFSDYLRALSGPVRRLLEGKINRTKSGGRLGLLQREELIHDFLSLSFAPFVGDSSSVKYFEQDRGNWDLDHLAAEIAQKKAFNLVGAHYRSAGSNRGRRSAFSTNIGLFKTLLNTECSGAAEFTEGPHAEVFESLWHAVYLEQYFNVFNPKNTFNEWVRKRGSALPIAVRQLSDDALFPAERDLSCRNSEDWIDIPIPRSLAEALVSANELRAFLRAISQSVVEAIGEHKNGLESFARASLEIPTRLQLVSWNSLLSTANSLARQKVGISLARALEGRRDNCLGMLLFDDRLRQFKGFLERYLPSPEGGSAMDSSQAGYCREVIAALQSLRFYSCWFGENCVTIPARKSEVRENSNQYVGEDYDSSVTAFWSSSDICSKSLIGLGPDLEQTFWVLDQLVAEASHFRPSRNSRSSPVDRELLDQIQLDSDQQLDRVDIHCLLEISRDLSSALREGKPRRFSFILGSPEWLIADLAVVHDLLSKNHPYCIEDYPNDRVSYERTLSLLRGNSTFLQDEHLALFVPYPCRPLEISHIVRIPIPIDGRRTLFEEFTRGKKAVLVVNTYGNGQGELIHKGEVKGVLSYQREWIKIEKYADFLKNLGGLLAQLGSRAKILLNCLEPAIRRISEDPGTGAIFAIVKQDRVEDLLADSQELTSVIGSVEGRPLSQLDGNLVYELARDDGATIVCAESHKVWGRRHLPSFPIRENLEEDWKAAGIMYWPKWFRVLRWGTRHRTALGLSRHLGESGLVIVVSADGPVNVFSNGRGVAEFGETFD